MESFVNMDESSSHALEDLSGLKIRKMTVDDLEQVIAIDQMSFSLPWPARSFRFELTDNLASRCWVADLDGRVAGMAVAWLIVDEIHVATIAIHPDFRGHGLGEKLLLQVLKSAKEEGAVSSFLEVREGNNPAITLYRKFGYVESGRRKGYYKDNGEDAILMTLAPLNL
jgi:ribosomal-protein-alanine N-acetyltransferase